MNFITNKDIEGVTNYYEQIVIFREYIRKKYINIENTPARVKTITQNCINVFTSGEIKSSNIWISGYRSYILSGNYDRRLDLFCIVDHHNSGYETLIYSDSIRVWRCAILVGLMVESTIKHSLTTLTLIGCGRIGVACLNSILAVKKIKKVRVYLKNENNIPKSLLYLKKKYSIDIKICKSIRSAVSNTNIIVTATNSSSPVLTLRELTGNFLIINVGPKYQNNSELSPEIYNEADIIITDSMNQFNSDLHQLQFKKNKKNLQCFSIIDIINTKNYNKNLKNKNVVILSLGLAATDIFLAYSILRRINERK